MTYHGIQLPYASTTRFNQETGYDDMGGTDFCYQNFDIQVQCIINAAYLQLLAPDLVVDTGDTDDEGDPILEDATDSPADIMNAIRKRLLKPRKTLSVKIDGVELIPQATAGPGTVDAANGPKPQSCSILQLTNTTFLVTYHITAKYWECPEIDPEGDPIVTNTDEAQNPILFNRWTESVDIDTCQFSTRTRNGKYVIRSDNAKGIIADMVREQMVTVGVPKGFLRTVSHYQVQADGLAIQYQLVDKEQFKMPPNPAFEASGYYSESVTLKGQPFKRGEIQLRLKGSKDTAQDQLMTLATLISIAKLNAASNGSSDMVILHGALRQNLFENEIFAHFIAQLPPATDASEKATVLGMWGINYKALCFTPTVDPIPPGVFPNTGSSGPIPPSNGQPPNYRTRGSADLLLQAAAYYDPCLANTLNAQTGQMLGGLSPGEAGKIKEQDPEEPTA